MEQMLCIVVFARDHRFDKKVASGMLFGPQMARHGPPRAPSKALRVVILMPEMGDQMISHHELTPEAIKVRPMSLNRGILELKIPSERPERHIWP